MNAQMCPGGDGVLRLMLHRLAFVRSLQPSDPACTIAVKTQIIYTKPTMHVRGTFRTSIALILRSVLD